MKSSTNTSSKRAHDILLVIHRKAAVVLDVTRKLEKLVACEQFHRATNVVMDNVTPCLRCYAKVARGLISSHLEGCGNHQLNRGTRWLGKHMHKAPLFAFLTVKPPKAVLEIPLGH